MSRTTSTRFSALRKPVVLALLVVVVILGGTLAWFWVDNMEEHREARDRVEKSFTEAVPRSSSDMARKVSYLRSIGVVGDEVASSTADVCWIDHDDSGWMAVNYNQTCYIVTVQGLAMPSGGAGSPALPSELAPGWERGIGDCQILTEGERLGYAHQTSVTKCEPPSPASTEPIVAYAAADARTKVLTQTGSAWGDSGDSVIWVTQYNQYFDEDLGCASPRFLTCESPLSEPIMESRTPANPTK